MSTINFKVKCQDQEEIFGGDRITDRELYMTIQTTADTVNVFDEYGDVIVGEGIGNGGLFTAIGKLYQAYEAWYDENEIPHGVELCGKPTNKKEDEYMVKASCLINIVRQMMFYHKYDGQRLGEVYTKPKDWDVMIDQAEQYFKELVEMSRSHNPIGPNTISFPSEHLTY